MPNLETNEQEEIYEMLQGLWDKTDSVDDVFEEISGYINGFNSKASKLAEAEALLRRIDWRGHVGDQDHEDIRRFLSGGGE